MSDLSRFLAHSRLLSSCAVLALASLARGETTPFDCIARAYAPYLNADDPLAWPTKVWSLTANEYKFWRGSKDLFFLWARAHCADWAADTEAYVPAHGDLHQANIGTYASEEGFGKLAFGMVDFDDASVLPFQIELLQGLITSRLLAASSGLVLSPAERAQADSALVETYRDALRAGKAATDMLSSDRRIKRMLRAGVEVAYEAELLKFCEGSTFRTRVINAKGDVTDALSAIDAADHRRFADAIAGACTNDESMARRMRATTVDGIHLQIKAVALRTRLGSSGSQELKKYLVLLDRPLIGVDHDVILYLKQQIPTAAERAGFIAAEGRMPGERAYKMTGMLTSPKPFINGHAKFAGQSYSVSLKEPWSDELSDRVRDLADLREAAIHWGIVAGSAMQDPTLRTRVFARLDEDLTRLLSARADEYVAHQAVAFQSFLRDPRTAGLRKRAAEALSSFER